MVLKQGQNGTWPLAVKLKYNKETAGGPDFYQTPEGLQSLDLNENHIHILLFTGTGTARGHHDVPKPLAVRKLLYFAVRKKGCKEAGRMMGIRVTDAM